MQNSKIEMFYPAYNTGTGAEDLRYYYQHDHLGSASVVTLKTGKTDQYLQYLPYGELFVSQKNHAFDSRYKFSAKELDNETGYSYFGARYYDSGLSMWLSVDPMAYKYPNISPYNYCGNNPIGFIDIDGNEFIGINNKKVNVRESNNGKIRVGLNSGSDLRKMARMINKSGSSTAKSQFMAIDKSQTKVHFSFSNEKIGGNTFGYHQPFDKNGNKLEWDSDKWEFIGNPAFIKDANGNNIYKESSITIYSSNIENNMDYFQEYFTADPISLTPDEASVGVFSHESFHTLDNKTINSIINSINGIKDNFNVEQPAEAIQQKTYLEIWNNKND